MSYELIWEPRGVLRKFTGNLTFSDVMSSSVTVESDPRFDDIRYVISDFSGVKTTEIGRDDIAEIVAIDAAAARSNKRIQGAVVVADGTMLTLVLDYVNSPMNTYPVFFFGSLESARSWATDL